MSVVSALFWHAAGMTSLGERARFQFVMYGLVGFIPGAISSWLVHKFVGELPDAPAHPPAEKAAGA